MKITKKRIAAPAASVLATAALAACGAAVAQHRASHPATTATASVAAAAARSEQKWFAGPGGVLLKTVESDLGTLTSDAQAGATSAGKNDGMRLEADARAALSRPMPPTDAQDYARALNDFAATGGLTANGHFTDATTLLDSGVKEIAKVTAAANLAAGS